MNRIILNLRSRYVFLKNGDIVDISMLTPKGTCPTKGCYGPKTVEWEYVEQDSQFLEDGE